MLGGWSGQCCLEGADKVAARSHGCESNINEWLRLSASLAAAIIVVVDMVGSSIVSHCKGYMSDCYRW